MEMSSLLLIDSHLKLNLLHYGLLRKVRPSRAQEPRCRDDRDGGAETEPYSGLRSWKDAQDIKERSIRALGR